MAIGKGRGGLDNQIICLKYLIFFFNVVAWLCGAVIFALATWIRFQDDFQEWIRELGMDHFWDGMWVLFAAGILIMMVSFFGCCGAISESPCMLIVYASLMGVCFLLQLAGAAYALDNGIEYSRLTKWSGKRFYELVSQYDENKNARKILNMIQEYIGCCGSYGPRDYDNLGKSIPDECRNHVTGNVYKDGCTEVFAWYMETKAGWIAGIALSLCFLQIFGLGFTICLCQALRREKRLRDMRGY